MINLDELRIIAHFPRENAHLGETPSPYEIYSTYDEQGERILMIECICGWMHAFTDIMLTTARIDIQEIEWKKHYSQCKIAQVVLGDSTEPLDPTWGS